MAVRADDRQRLVSQALGSGDQSRVTSNTLPRRSVLAVSDVDAPSSAGLDHTDRPSYPGRHQDRSRSASRTGREMGEDSVDEVGCVDAREDAQAYRDTEDRLRDGHREHRAKWCTSPPRGPCASRSLRRRRHRGDVAEEPITLLGEDGRQGPERRDRSCAGAIVVATLVIGFRDSSRGNEISMSSVSQVRQPVKFMALPVQVDTAADHLGLHGRAAVSDARGIRRRELCRGRRPGNNATLGRSGLPEDISSACRRLCRRAHRPSPWRC